MEEEEAHGQRVSTFHKRQYPDMLSRQITSTSTKYYKYVNVSCVNLGELLFEHNL